MSGRAWRFGDHVNTDVIIPAGYLNMSTPEELVPHCMEDTDNEGFKAALASDGVEGDVFVAGENFGCGSSREHAPIAIKGAGISYVIAKGFARIFYRNAFNIGLPVFVCLEAVDGIEQGDQVLVDMAAGSIENVTKGEAYQAQPIPAFMRELIECGGLMERTKRHYLSPDD